MTVNPEVFEVKPIGYVHSPFKEKFGVPRQPGMIKSTTATIELIPPYNTSAAFSGLEEFSHIWLTFCFHQNDHRQWRPLVRPPRLGGNNKVGVFACRSSFRPNGLGMSVVELLAIRADKGTSYLEIACPDLIDGTPIVDIRPYIAFADAVPEARCGFAENRPAVKLSTRFSPQSQLELAALPAAQYGNLRLLIEETLGYDPRPAYKPEVDHKQYGIRLYDLNILWRVSHNEAEVLSITRN